MVFAAFLVAVSKCLTRQLKRKRVYSGSGRETIQCTLGGHGERCGGEHVTRTLKPTAEGIDGTGSVDLARWGRRTARTNF